MPSLAMELGGACLALEGGSDDWLARLTPQLGAFWTRRPPDFVLRLVPDESVVRCPEEAFEDSSGSVRTTVDGDRLILRGRSLRAELDLATRRGTLEAPPYLYPMASVLRRLVPSLVNGLVLHGCLLVHEEKAYVGAGSSGCGKSTLASLLPDLAVCDELVAIRSEGTEYWAHGLPFWNGHPARAPLAAVNLLSHGDRTARRPLQPREAFRLLSAHVLWPLAPEDSVERCLRAAADLAASVPVRALAFRPLAEVREILLAP